MWGANLVEFEQDAESPSRIRTLPVASGVLGRGLGKLVLRRTSAEGLLL